jgi:hypothetical protein
MLMLEVSIQFYSNSMFLAHDDLLNSRIDFTPLRCSSTSLTFIAFNKTRRINDQSKQKLYSTEAIVESFRSIQRVPATRLKISHFDRAKGRNNIREMKIQLKSSFVDDFAEKTNGTVERAIGEVLLYVLKKRSVEIFFLKQKQNPN